MTKHKETPAANKRSLGFYFYNMYGLFLRQNQPLYFFFRNIRIHFASAN